MDVGDPSAIPVFEANCSSHSVPEEYPNIDRHSTSIPETLLYSTKKKCNFNHLSSVIEPSPLFFLFFTCKQPFLFIFKQCNKDKKKKSRFEKQNFFFFLSVSPITKKK